MNLQTNFVNSVQTLFTNLKFNVWLTMSYLQGKTEQTLDKPSADNMNNNHFR